MTILELHNLTKKMLDEGIPSDREVVYREKSGKLGKIDYSVSYSGEKSENKTVQVLAEEWY